MTTPLIEAKARLENLESRDWLDQMMNDYGLAVIDPYSDVGERKIEMNKLRHLIKRLAKEG